MNIFGLKYEDKLQLCHLVNVSKYRIDQNLRVTKTQKVLDELYFMVGKTTSV